MTKVFSGEGLMGFLRGLRPVRKDWVAGKSFIRLLKTRPKKGIKAEIKSFIRVLKAVKRVRAEESLL
ncbi:hypothetical protein SAMN05877753_103330 [Bacillus oleivorans]|uniref:Uncharacterized protein n=2 Tax=Bacillus oleivorans TaxID=1448271 RepID=A0A285CSD3_9BACI|nr:hypothetical protein SAMN05877753_103330 [Bacillus oleivorans]